jgi:hypothetical protein
MFAILRTQKHSTLDSIASRASHHLRTHSVPNADASRSHENFKEGPQSPKEMKRAFDAATTHLRTRKDNVLCIEILLTASPEFFKTSSGNSAFEIGKVAQKWLHETFGSSNVVGLGIHMDETTPHVWALVTPIVAGKLNCKTLLGTPPKMRKLQDGWAEACKPLGLARGIKKSGARHIDVATYYAAANGHAGAQAALEKETRVRLARAQEMLAGAVNLRQKVLAEASVTLATVRAMDKQERADLYRHTRDEIPAAIAAVDAAAALIRDRLPRPPGQDHSVSKEEKQVRLRRNDQSRK